MAKTSVQSCIFVYILLSFVNFFDGNLPKALDYLRKINIMYLYEFFIKKYLKGEN